MSDASTKPSFKQSMKHAYSLFKDYFFHSDEKKISWLLLIGGLICIAGMVALMFVLSWWTAGFWALLAAKSLVPCLISLAQFAGILLAVVTLHVVKNFLMERLSIRWRTWLTKNILDKLFSDKKYVDLKRFPSVVDNVAQRVQQDTRNFVHVFLNIVSNVFRSVLTLGVFSYSLWNIGGPLIFAMLGINIIIPGYLVWVALLVALAATLATHYIGKSLAAKSQKAEEIEASFRQNLAQFNEAAESVAEEGAEEYYDNLFKKKLEEINEVSKQKLKTQSGLLAFQNFFQHAASILAVIITFPLYFFKGAIEFSQLTQVIMSFSQVSSACSVFVENYDDLTKATASGARLSTLEIAMSEGGLPEGAKDIVITPKPKNYFKTKNLCLKEPKNSSKAIFTGLNLKIKHGKHVMLMGESGVGKSTLFKVFSKTWQYGSGKVVTPSNQSICILSQVPTLPPGTLMSILAYPQPSSTYTQEEYRKVLTAVGGMSRFIDQLEVENKWDSVLSGGQKQRIAIARVLLKKPDWLFLDEATASLDETSEEHVYGELKKITNMTMISIGHRSTLKKYHSRILFFKVNEQREIAVDEERLSPDLNRD